MVLYHGITFFHVLGGVAGHVPLWKKIYFDDTFHVFSIFSVGRQVKLSTALSLKILVLILCATTTEMTSSSVQK